MNKIAIALLSLLAAPLAALAFETAQSVTATPITALPFTITASGNYFLPTNLNFNGAGAAITVNASEVTIDLNGRSLIAQGVAKSPNVGIGILVINQESVTIKDGDIKDFGNYGVLLDSTDKKKEHNQQDTIDHVNFTGDEIGVLTISGSINLIEHCLFDSNAVGIYDIASLGGDRCEFDLFENQQPREAFAIGAGIVSTPGKGILVEFCDFSDDVTAGAILQGAQDALRFNTFLSDGAKFIGGRSLGLADN